MNLPTPAPRFALLAMGALLGMTAPAASFAADWQALTGNSPFGQTSGNTVVVPPDQLEFRGVVQEEGVYLVNLFNPSTKTSQWIPVNGKAPGLEVRSYDAASDKVELMQGGKTLTLPLKQARVTLVQPAAPAAPQTDNGEGPRGDRSEGREGREGMRNRGGPGGNNGNGGSGENPMVRNLPPEAQAMIQEFRRRRAERANTNQQQQQQAQPVQPIRQP